VKDVFNVVILCAVLMGGIVSLVPVALAENISHRTLAEQFRRVVFFTEAGEGASGKPLLKWTGRISATIFGGEIYRQNVLDLLKEISRLTGLKFSLALIPKQANLKIYFMRTSEIRKRLKLPNANCAGQFHGSRKTGAIGRAEVYISTDLKHKTVHCISEEILQVMGLPNDTNIIQASIFNEKSTLKTMSLADKLLLRTIYDKRLKTNMTESQAMPIAKNILRELIIRLQKSQNQRRNR